MSVTVKICGITNAEDARAAVEAGADALGFMFYEKSPRAIHIADASRIVAELPPFIAKFGVFVDPAPDFVVEAIRSCSLNALQFHGTETPEFCRQFGVMSVKAFRVKDAASLGDLPRYSTDAWLLDSYVSDRLGGSGERFNWELAVQAKSFGRPIFLAGGLTPENVGAAVAQVQPFGVDVSSGVESAPGKKDLTKLKHFVDAAKKGATPDK